MEDLRKCHGIKFRCKISGIAAEGVISVIKNAVYLCQNEMQAADTPEKLGYRHGWWVHIPIRKSWEEALASADVRDFKLLGDYVETIETTHFLTI